ncbi:hypothetical protein [Paraburkholderia strydomiana]|uniref:hypothetical protein n=1 Tax=Paraburkholderia strydomiana TaxID=1245417 RepID=UPI00285C1526|nr:hypothetical protein [Paraburkholderia strydomiana]MDR7009644.1 hypothetical protein [Paraburkholderia strydomiana]
MTITKKLRENTDVQMANEQELPMVIEFIDSTRAPLTERIAGMAPDPDWALTSTLVRAKLRQQGISISQRIKASGLTYGTAHRRINTLIDDSLIDVCMRRRVARHRYCYLPAGFCKDLKDWRYTLSLWSRPWLAIAKTAKARSSITSANHGNPLSSYFPHRSLSLFQAIAASDCGSCFTTTTMVPMRPEKLCRCRRPMHCHNRERN